MKKHVNLWLVMFLAISLALPIYSMAQTLTLESYTTGDRISGGPIKTFSMGPDGSLVVYLNGPFTFSSLLPDITVDGSTYSGCTVSPPASVSANQGATLSFRINSTTAGASFSGGPDAAKPGLVVDPEPAATSFATTTATPPNTATGIFTWTTGGGTGPVPVGSYLAVFQASDTATPPHTSQLVVMININPPETVSTPAVSGPVAGTVNQFYTFTVTTPSTVTPSGDPVKYFFDWGDGSNSGWVSGTSAQHSWGNTGIYSVKVQAQCATHTSVVSAWSGTSSITISNVPTYTVTVSVVNSAGGSVSPPSVSGITSGGQAIFNVTINSSYTASVSGGTLSGTTGTVNWTFTNVTSDLNATITFTQTPSGQALVWCNRYQFSIAAGATKVFIATVDSNRAGLTVDIQGITNETNARFTWTFPDSRTFPPPGEPWIYGIGTSGGKMALRAQAAGFLTNIPDQYIPFGQHVLTINATGASNVVMTVN